MGDTIYRQAAIDALGERPMVWVESDYELGARNQYDADVLALEALPPAQPETKQGEWIPHSGMFSRQKSGKLWKRRIKNDGKRRAFAG